MFFDFFPDWGDVMRISLNRVTDISLLSPHIFITFPIVVHIIGRRMGEITKNKMQARQKIAEIRKQQVDLRVLDSHMYFQFPHQLEAAKSRIRTKFRPGQATPRSNSCALDLQDALSLALGTMETSMVEDDTKTKEQENENNTAETELLGFLENLDEGESNFLEDIDLNEDAINFDFNADDFLKQFEENPTYAEDDQLKF